MHSMCVIEKVMPLPSDLTVLDCFTAIEKSFEDTKSRGWILETEGFRFFFFYLEIILLNIVSS